MIVNTINDSERLKRMLKQDIEWMSEEGFYTVANRLARVLEYIEELERANDQATNA